VAFEVDFQLAILAHAIRGGLEAVLAELFTFFISSLLAPCAEIFSAESNRSG
jgi:hypothetical protein